MKLNGRRESNNVDDRRGLKPKAAGLGIGGMVVAALLVWIFGGNPSSVLQLAGNGTTENTEYVATAEEEALAKFASQIWCCSKMRCRVAAAVPPRRRDLSIARPTSVCIWILISFPACVSSWEPTATLPMPM